MSNVIKILPENFTYTKDKSFNNVMITFAICIASGFYFIIQWRNSSDPLLGVFFGLLCLTYPVINFLYARFPTEIEIDKTQNILRVKYLNGFGVQKSDTINLSGAMIRNIPRLKIDNQDRQIRITQSVFNNWIYIDETHGFSRDQIKYIYECLNGSHQL